MDDNKISGLKNPFAGFNASLMDSEDIVQYWIQPEILFERQAVGVDLTGEIPVVLMGGRGTGKTMLLKFLSHEVQIKYLLDEERKKNFLKNTKFIGIYHRFDGPSLSSFSNRNIDDVAWETIFKHYFEIVIGQKYISMLLTLITNECLTLTSTTEKSIVADILNLIDLEQSQNEEENYLENLNKTMQIMARDVFQYINEAALCETPKFYSRPIITSGQLIFGIPQILIQKIPEFQNKNILILLDEYENLLFQQQKIVNTLIKHVKKPVTFRLGTRLYGFKTYDTLNEDEFLMEDADYRKILFEDILLANNTNYKNLLKKIAKKRLENVEQFKKIGFLDIEDWLDELNPVEEALHIVYEPEIFVKEKNLKNSTVGKQINDIRKELISKNIPKSKVEELISKLQCRENPLIEMLNLLLLRRDYDPNELINFYKVYKNGEKDKEEYKKYRELYNKNELGLLFQLLSLYRPKKKMYAGFNTLSMLSSGIIRNFLEICYQIFNLSLFYDRENIIKNGKIQFQIQTEGAEIRAEKFYSTIERIPKYGNQIKSLVTALGAIFYAWHKDPRLREPEVTYFCVDKTSLSDEARKILETAVQWSVLQQKKSMKGKTSDEQLLDVYAMNHILSPYFTISYRLRGRIPQFNKNDVETLIFGEEQQKQRVINRLGRWTGIQEQQYTLFDFGE
ncbi:hypothetical protein KJA15_04450 [Patescibacteria group bacterium]|nr:hypothetical protein [Patescibacteria group bacterium]